MINFMTEKEFKRKAQLALNIFTAVWAVFLVIGMLRHW